MIGRGTYGRPWFIGQVIHYLRTGARLPDPRPTEQLATLLEHYEAILEHYGIEAGRQDRPQARLLVQQGLCRIGRVPRGGQPGRRSRQGP